MSEKLIYLPNAYICLTRHEHGSKKKSKSGNRNHGLPDASWHLGSCIIIIYYTLDEFDIADPSSMQDACHIST